MIKKLIAKSPLKDTALKIVGTKGYMPKYFIAGVGRSGTTLLYDYMIQHPQITPSRQKEMQFWDSNFDKGYKWYKGFFPKDNCIDATPSYWRNQESLQKISASYDIFPKMIIILREPIARLESVINFAISRNDKYSFDEYIQQGIYHEYLNYMFRHWGKTKFHIMFLEDLQRNPIRELNKVFDFLNLDKFDIKPLDKINAGIYSKRLTNDQKKELEFIYETSNKNLAYLLGRKLPW